MQARAAAGRYPPRRPGSCREARVAMPNAGTTGWRAPGPGPPGGPARPSPAAQPGPASSRLWRPSAWAACRWRGALGARRHAGTVDRILDVAERLVQVRGFNAFSYADVSQALGIQKASLHHHFATKADLGVALVDRYRRHFFAALEAIESTDDAGERLARYADLYRSVLRKRRMCMCGMLAADVATLPRPMREGVAEFFTGNEAWLTRILTAGRARGELRFAGSPESVAAFFVSSLEGAMLVSRGTGQLEHLDAVAALLLASLRPDRANSPALRPSGPDRRGRA